MSKRFNTLLFTMIFVSSPWAISEENTIGAFAIGRGGAAATEAVNVQHKLRELIKTTGSLRQINFLQLLHTGQENERQLAQAEALDILKQGKHAYDELELEDAQSKFELALKKFEYSYGYLKDPGNMIEAMMFLGATLVLAGQTDKGQAVFRRVAFMPGQKTLSEDLFPPNIQEIFKKAKEQIQESSAVKITLWSKPFGAAIYVDSIYKGGSPSTFSGMKPGLHMIRAVKDGFMPWGGKIKVRPRGTNKFRLSLKPLPKRKGYSSVFGRMSAEIIKADPGHNTEKFCKFLGVNRLIVAALEGEPSSMTIRAYTITSKPEMTFEQHRKVFVLNEPGYDSHLKEFLLKLIEFPSASENSSGGDFDQGEEQAAKLLAAQQGSENSQDETFGLDLGESSSGKQEAQVPDTIDEDHYAGPPKDRQDSTDSDIAAEQNKEQAEQASKVVETTSGTKPLAGLRQDTKKDSEKQFSFTWTYLHDKWWFWTAVGVVAAGAATGTYFAITAGSEEGGGTLVLGIH